tara:strand:- start:62 stop:331 length:270 start_codon:yes stop_codon:yes gene_type:complete
MAKYQQLARVDEISNRDLWELAHGWGVDADSIIDFAEEIADDSDDLPIMCASSWGACCDVYHSIVGDARYALVMHPDDSVGVYRQLSRA